MPSVFFSSSVGSSSSRMRPRTFNGYRGFSTDVEVQGDESNEGSSCTVVGSNEAILATEAATFMPASPSWNGGSTARPCISGTYFGPDDTIEVEALDSGDVSAGATIRLRLLDGEGRTIEILRIGQPNLPAVSEIGIQVSLGFGRVCRGDRFEFLIWASETSGVDVDRPFGGSLSRRARIQEESAGMLPVRSGSFLIDGTRINVEETDTVRTVLDKIEQSAAAVSARFQVLSDSVVLTRTNPGAYPIRLEGDTSGFLAAVKLESPQVVLGCEVVPLDPTPVVAQARAKGRFSPLALLFGGKRAVNA